jgi:succinate dehydrogenase / fumarate reductase flavoprotein subunit
VFRDEAGLLRAGEAIRLLSERYARIGLTNRDPRYNYEALDALELGNLIDLGAVVTACALRRRESRGAHSREDFPARDDAGHLCHTLAFRDAGGVRLDTKPVTIGRFEPGPRTY